MTCYSNIDKQPRARCEPPKDPDMDLKTTPNMIRTNSEPENGTVIEEDQFERIELERDRFSAWSVAGIQISITAAPLAVMTYVGLVNGVGGTSYFFWCYLVAVVGQLFVATSMAEIAAFLPHASGTCE